MNKIVKFVVWPLVGLVVIVVAIGAYIAATFDPNQYKPQIVQAVKDKTQRILKLDGNIKLSLFPSIGATLDKASLSERASDREFAGADDLHVALKLIPLLSKQVVVDAIEAKNLRANLVRFKDGKTNIDDLTGGGDTSASTAKSGEPQVKIEIDHVTLKNATVTYTDQAAGAKYAISKLNLKTGRIANGVPSKIDISLTAQSDKPKLDVEAELKATVTFDPANQHYVLEGLDLSAKGIAAGISNLAAT
ncbi:MAG TPA: AsmA family protein, partial [Burkholderiales bacterium]|nr:AsmA family protein [Burkholderiales bacterium]